MKSRYPALFCFLTAITVIYFKWAAQDSASLPGLAADTESIIEIINDNPDILFVSVFGVIPTFYWSVIWLTPGLILKNLLIKMIIFISSLIIYFFILSFMIRLFFPMYYFFGTPYAIKVLAPIIIISAFGGYLSSFNIKIINGCK